MKRLLRAAILISLPLLLWTGAATVLPAYLVASPGDVLRLASGSYPVLANDLLVTALESVCGLFLALFLSFLTAIAFRLIPGLEAVAMPYAIALKSVPIVAISPLLVIWLGNGIAGKIVLASLVCFFPILIGLSDGLKSLPTDLQQLSCVWSRSRVTRLRLLELPYSMPYLLSAMKVAAPLATVGAVVAEYSGADRGLGHMILIAAYRIDTPLMFLGILSVSLLGVGLFLAAVLVERRALRRMRVYRAN